MNTLIESKTTLAKRLGGRSAAKDILRCVSRATLLVVIFFSPSFSWAGGVVTNATEANLRAVMSGGGTVTFACDGTITLANTITNTLDTVLDGSGHSIIISGPQAFYVCSNSIFSVFALKIANCWAMRAEAIFNDYGTVNLNQVVLENNSASPAWGPITTPYMVGGAIWNQGGAIKATNCTFAGNSAWMLGYSSVPASLRPRGGAFFNDSGAVVLQQCVFTANQATAGPVDYGLPDQGLESYGGAIYNNWGNLTVDSCTFVSNSANGGNGGIGPMNSGWGGGSGGAAHGGAIYNAGAVIVSRSLFASNSASAGSGGYGANGPSGQIYGGNGGGGGWGAPASGGAVDGGGAFVNCTFAGNTAHGGRGGGGGAGGNSLYQIGAQGGEGGNGGSADGGAISGAPSLANCTIAACSAIAGGGGAGGAGGYGSKGCGVAGSSGFSGVASGGGAGGTLINTLLVSNAPGTDTFPDSKLAPLADNGGPTVTMALLPGSPAIDAGDTSTAPFTDQRGFPRPAGSAADIGAFEYGSMMPMLSITRSVANQVEIVVQGNSNRWCRLIASSNFANWIPIATNQIGGDGKFVYYDNPSPGVARRYYRVAMP